jgi:hypothetical protein
MSIEIHLQFDDSDPEQERAFNVLDAWRQQGYSDEQIITRALTAFADGREQATNINILLANVREMLQQMREVLKEVRTIRLREASESSGRTESAAMSAAMPDETNLELSSVFLAALKKAARPGMRLEN